MEVNAPEIEYFSERQAFSPRLLGFIVLSTALVGGFAYMETRDAPGAETGLTITLGALALLIGVFSSLSLTTSVTDASVSVKGLWFVNRIIRFEDIASAEMRNYKPILEYGGWGYRIGPSGKAYNAQGDEGVQLVLKDGGRVLIGSQRARELADAISSRLRK